MKSYHVFFPAIKIMKAIGRRRVCAVRGSIRIIKPVPTLYRKPRQVIRYSPDHSGRRVLKLSGRIHHCLFKIALWATLGKSKVFHIACWTKCKRDPTVTLHSFCSGAVGVVGIDSLKRAEASVT